MYKKDYVCCQITLQLKGTPHYYMNQSISEQENYRPEWEKEVKQRQS
jgi:hypothetical protein